MTTTTRLDTYGNLVVRIIKRKLANMVTEWENYNNRNQDAFAIEVLEGLIEKGFYRLADDITITGKPYSIELFELGLERRA